MNIGESLEKILGKTELPKGPGQTTTTSQNESAQDQTIDYMRTLVEETKKLEVELKIEEDKLRKLVEKNKPALDKGKKLDDEVEEMKELTETVKKLRDDLEAKKITIKNIIKKI